jgi:hypothetical protein
MSTQYGLPIDMSSKSGGLAVIAKALNEGDMVRAQVATAPTQARARFSKKWRMRWKS